MPWLVGGGDLIKQFLNFRLVDEIVLFVHPILLGKGVPLFLDFDEEIDLKLIETKTFNEDVSKNCKQHKAYFDLAFLFLGFLWEWS